MPCLLVPKPITCINEPDTICANCPIGKRAEELERLARIGENIEDYWKHVNCEAEDWRG